MSLPDKDLYRCSGLGHYLAGICHRCLEHSSWKPSSTNRYQNRQHNNDRLSGSARFGLAERTFHTEFAKALEYCYMPLQVVLPVDHGSGPGLAGDFHRSCSSTREAIDQSDAVVAILDGAVADSWTYFGIGYAKGKGKVVIGVRTDLGSSEGCDLDPRSRRL